MPILTDRSMGFGCALRSQVSLATELAHADMQNALCASRLRFRPSGSTRGKFCAPIEWPLRLIYSDECLFVGGGSLESQ